MKGGRLGQNFLLYHAAVCTVCECGREGGYVMGLVIVFFVQLLGMSPAAPVLANLAQRHAI